MQTELNEITHALRRLLARWALKEVDPEFTEVVAITARLESAARAAPGDVVVTTDASGRCVAVTRQDKDHRILSVIWEADGS